MTTGRTIAAAARAAARNRAVRALAISAGTAAARRVGPIAQERYDDWRDRRVHRDRAIKLARQMNGRYSQDTIIDGRPHFVVWKDGRPVQAFPAVEDLEARPELRHFDARLAQEPKLPRRARPGRAGGDGPLS
jgi:hypothetical protein